MSDWWLGQLARQDQYGDTPPANWPVPQMPEQPEERDPFEAAALRTRAPYRNLPAPGSNEGEGPTGEPAVFGVDSTGASRLIRQNFRNYEEAIDAAAELNKGGKKEPVHVLRITPELRAAAMKGFPLFTAGGVVAGGTIGELARQDKYGRNE